jgi:PAS domain S-box-containing protein
MKNSRSGIRFPWVVFLIFAGLSLGIVLAGLRFYWSGQTEIKKNIQNDLLAIADLKVKLINNWRQERMADAVVIRDNRLITNQIHQWLRKPSDASLPGILLVWMTALQRENGYQSVLLFDSAGKPRLGTLANVLEEGCDQKCLTAAMSTKDVVFSDLYRTKPGGHVFLDLYTPLVLEGMAESKVIGILMLRIDPYQFLYPLIQFWPTPSRTAETLIVRREGDNVLFLNELRHRQGTALSFSFPLQAPILPATEIASGKEGVMEGTDYRGVSALAAMRAVPDTSWYLIAQVDTDEVYAPIRERARLIAIGALLLIAFAGAGVSFWWKHQATQFYRRQLEAEKERQALARQADESHSQLAAIVEASRDAIIGINLEGNIVSWNPGAERMYGYRAEEMLNQPMTRLNPPDRPDEIPEILEKIRQGESLDDYETVRVRKDGTGLTVSLTISPIQDSAGKIYGASTIARNITERKKGEVERAQLLEREREARMEAEAANRMKDEFLATVSHELRTPLNPILGWAYTLRSGEVDPATRAEAYETIERNARLQSKLVEDLLDASRIITGKLHLEVQPVDLFAIIETAYKNIQAAAEAKTIQTTLELHPLTGSVSGDPGRLQQVVWNLLSNAVKFTPGGGKILVQLNQRKHQVEIVVSDTGNGIGPEFLPYVFDRFRQADSSITRKYGGLGLGLAIVRHLTELHGGTVQATSPGKGKGTTFRVNLPMLGSEKEFEPAPPPPVFRPGTELRPATLRLPSIAGLKILVTEDDPDSGLLVAKILAQQHAEVKLASSAAEARKIIRDFLPDMLISDIEMPEEDGYSLMRRIRELPEEEGGGTLAIALTAHAREEDRRLALESGYNVHVAKPVEPDLLIRTVANLTGRG